MVDFFLNQKDSPTKILVDTEKIMLDVLDWKTYLSPETVNDFVLGIKFYE